MRLQQASRTNAGIQRQPSQAVLLIVQVGGKTDDVDGKERKRKKEVDWEEVGGCD